MPRTKKTTGSSTTAKRGTAAKRTTTTSRRSTTPKRGTPASTASKRKTGAKITASRAKTGSRRPAAAPPKGSRVFKFKLLATVFVCIAIVVLAILGTVFYEKLVPEKKPVTAKGNGIEVVQPTQTSVPPTAQTPVSAAKPDKTPSSTDKPDSVAVVEPAKPENQAKPAGTTEPAKPEPTLLAQATTPVSQKDPADTQPKATTPDSGKPKLALIFDDVGYDAAAAKKLQDLKLPLTFSILPYSPHGQSIASNVPAHIEVMVHVPMQAINGDSDKEQGLLRSDMTEAELAQMLRDDIARIPNAKGINNHTGSRLTQQLVPMQVVMLVLKEKNLFFVDSVTSDKSVAKSTAEMLLVPSAARNVFLDHVADVATIKAQLYRAVNLAKQNGVAIAIGHPRPLTLEVVLQELPKIAKENDIELVPVSILVK